MVYIVHLFNKRYLLKKFNTIYINNNKYVFLGKIDDNEIKPDINCIYINKNDKVVLRTIQCKKFENHVELIVPGKAQAKGRPKFVRRGRFVQTYTDKKTLTAESQIKKRFKSLNNRPKIAKDTPVSIEVNFEMPIPVSLSKKKQEAINLKPTLSKPDLDNLVKLILDALNKVAYKDDALITELVCRKYYSRNPKSIIKINY